MSRLTQLLRGYKFEARFLALLYKWGPPLVTISNVESVLRQLFHGTRIAGDKFTDYIFNLNQLAETDEISIVVIYRDCRDVTPSYLDILDTDWRKTPILSAFDTPQKIAERRLSAISWMTRYQHKMCTIRYEDLVQEPVREFERLAQWLDIDPKGFSIKFIHNSSVGSYGHRLSSDELSVGMQIPGPLMEELGYK